MTGKVWYRVSYETRKQEAIGRFYRRTRDVTATDETDALREARERWNVEGYETRNPTRVVAIHGVA